MNNCKFNREKNKNKAPKQAHGMIVGLNLNCIVLSRVSVTYEDAPRLWKQVALMWDIFCCFSLCIVLRPGSFGSECAYQKCKKNGNQEAQNNDTIYSDLELRDFGLVYPNFSLPSSWVGEIEQPQNPPFRWFKKQSETLIDSRYLQSIYLSARFRRLHDTNSPNHQTIKNKSETQGTKRRKIKGKKHWHPWRKKRTIDQEFGAGSGSLLSDSLVFRLHWHFHLHTPIDKIK